MLSIAAITAKESKQTAHLIHAVRNGAAEQIDACLRQGCDPNTRDQRGCPILCLAAAGGHLSAAAILLYAGADVDAPDSDGNTPLRFAAEEGMAEMVGFLLEMGANPERPNAFGYTPAYWAMQNGKHEVVRLIEEYIVWRNGSASRRQ